MTDYDLMSTKKILVADDSLTIQKVIRLALANEGYDIQTVSDGKDAVEQLAVFRPQVCLIDISLPTKDAFQVKAEFDRERGKKTRFVILANAFEKVDEAQVAAAQFSGRLTKPFDPAELRTLLAQIFSTIEPTGLIEKPESSTLKTPSAGSPPPPPSFPKAPPPFAAPSATPPPLSPPTFSPPPPPPGLSKPEFTNPTFEMPVRDFTKKEITKTSLLQDVLTPPPEKEEPTKFAEIIPPPPEAKPLGGPDDDIKQLTESTIRLSGLDGFDWTVQEPTPEPSFKPLPAHADLGGSTFTLDDPIVQPLTTGHLEDLIQKQVEATLEKMAKKLLPEVAEKVIKQEIRKLLEDKGI